MNTGDVIAAVLAAVQIAGILIGAIWAYYKFVRGRTFQRRGEISVSGMLLASHGNTALRAEVAFANTGGADIPLRAKIVEACAFGGVDENGRALWTRVASAPLFADHDWLESRETIRDDVLLPLEADAATLGYRITAIVIERRGKRWGLLKPRPGGIKWTGHAVVVPGDALRS